MKHLVGLAIVSLLICVTAHAQIYHVVRMNTDPLGHGGANEIGNKPICPRYSERMTSKEIISALAGANEDEVNRERKQREWMVRTGIN